MKSKYIFFKNERRRLSGMSLRQLPSPCWSAWRSRSLWRRTAVPPVRAACPVPVDLEHTQASNKTFITMTTSVASLLSSGHFLRNSWDALDIFRVAIIIRLACFAVDDYSNVISSGFTIVTPFNRHTTLTIITRVPKVEPFLFLFF